MHPERDRPQSQIPLTAAERAAVDAFLQWLRERFGSRVSEGDAVTDWDVLLSPLALSTQQLAELRARERRLAREIDHDGIAL